MLSSRVAIWFIFRPKISNWVQFGGPLENVVIFYDHLEYFVFIWYISPVLVWRTKKNLATLLSSCRFFAQITICHAILPCNDGILHATYLGTLEFPILRSGVDVMITMFSYFCQFSAKQLAFFSNSNVMIKSLLNVALFWVKNANFLRNLLRAKIFLKSKHRSLVRKFSTHLNARDTHFNLNCFLNP
jgi:hypothetical protein